jgi:hydrogenase/urease accessory protein HupE
MTRLSLLLFVIWISTAHLRAHPVAQGALAIDLREDHLSMRVRVSNEAVFVASTFARIETGASDLRAVFEQHGTYLLNHLRLRSEAGFLSGRLVEVKIPEDRTINGFASYEFKYTFTRRPPAEVFIQNSVLQDVPFAPGIPWTASFSVSQRRDGELIQEGLLLTHSDPLALDFGSSSRRPLHWGSLFSSYLRHGVAHILVGWDHLLFMAALVIAVTSFWDLVKVVTAFTVAHTVTLALSTFGIARLPSQFVEPVIALSIVVVAVQNVAFPASARSSSRLLLAFGFGLFHGLGFAGGLLEAMREMSTSATSTALAGFSVGVELGHQAVVIPIFAAMVLLRRSVTDAAPLTAAFRWASVAIAVAGCAYLGLALWV